VIFGRPFLFFVNIKSATVAEARIEKRYIIFKKFIVIWSLVICNSSAPPPLVEGEYLSANLISFLPLDGGGLGWG